MLTTCPDRTVHDRLRRLVAERYGIGHDGTARVRPDGYLGYLAISTSAEALATHLATREHLRL